MKNILSAFAIALLVAGTLSSCTDYEERLDKIDERINALENTKLTSLESQVAAIASSIAELEGIRNGIRALTATVSEQSQATGDIRAADEALNTRIDALQSYMNDKLKRYADKNLVAATYATLAQYDAANVTIADVNAKISPLSESLSKKIKDASDSFKEKTASLEDAIIELTGRVDALEQRIQSIKIIPAFDDGSVNARYSLLTVDCVIEPASAVRNLTKDNFAVLLSTVRTKAANGVDTVRLTDDSCLTKNFETGIVSLRVGISGFTPESGKSLIVAVGVNTGISDCVTEFAKAEITAAPDKELKAAEAFYNTTAAGSSWIFKMGPEDGTSYPKLTVTTKTTRDKEHISGNYEIATALLETSSTESVNYAGGIVSIECVSSEGFYNFKGTTTDDEGYEMDFNGSGVLVEAYDATNGNAFINLLDNVAEWAKVPVTGITLDRNEIELTDGDADALVATVEPYDASDNGVLWSSNKPDVVSVDYSGGIKALKAGIAVITATTSDGGLTAVCTVKVNPIPVESITLDRNTLELAVGSGNKQLTATILPVNASDKTIIWTSDNAAVATVVEGSVSGVSAGVAKITATASNGSSCYCTVTVVNGKGFDFSIEPYAQGESY